MAATRSGGVQRPASHEAPALAALEDVHKVVALNVHLESQPLYKAAPPIAGSRAPR